MFIADDTQFCTHVAEKVETSDVIKFKDLKVGTVVHKNGKFEKLSVDWKVAAKYIIGADGTKKARIVAEMVTKNRLINPFGFSAQYFYALEVEYEGSETTCVTTLVVDEKLVMTEDVVLPESCKQIPELNCYLTIILRRKSISESKLRSFVKETVERNRLKRLSHRYNKSKYENYCVVIGNETFKVNKSVLQKAGREFRDLIDKSGNSKKFVDCDTNPEAFEILLHYIYGLEVDFDSICTKANVALFFNILKASIKYRLRSLRGICSGYLLLNFTSTLKDLRDGFIGGEFYQLREYRDYCREAILFDHLYFYEPFFPVDMFEGEKTFISELIKAEEIPEKLTLKKVRAYADVAELYRNKLQESAFRIEPKLIEETIREFLKRKVAGI